MERLFGIFAEYIDGFGNKVFVHTYRYCTKIDVIKEKRLLEDTLLDLTLNHDEENIYIWDEDILDQRMLKKENLFINRLDTKEK